MSVKLRLDQLEALAHSIGYESYRDMLQDLYVVQGMSFYEIAKRCNVSYDRTKKHLKRFGIPIRGRGGRHESTTKIKMTPALVQEIYENGLTSTAERLGVDSSRLLQQLKKLVHEKSTEQHGK